MGKRRQPNDYVRLAAGRLVESGFAVEVIADAIKVPARDVTRWMASMEDGYFDLNEGPDWTSAQQAEVSRLRGALGRMTAERDILKGIISSTRWGDRQAACIEQLIDVSKKLRQRPMDADATELGTAAPVTP